MPSPCCPKTPQEAGASSVAQLKDMATRYPHLRPCPRHRGTQGTMMWINRKHCSSCFRAEQTKAGPDA